LLNQKHITPNRRKTHRKIRSKQPAKPLRPRQIQKNMKNNLVNSNIFCNFAPSVPAKPLYNAQIGGAFF